MNQESQPLSGPPAPSSQPTAAPETDTKKQLDPSSWSKILKTALECLRHYRDTPREKSKRSDVVMVILTLGIAIAAFWSAWIFQGQLTDSQNANNRSEGQWETQQRPWVGLSGGVEFTKPPIFQVFAVNAAKSTGIELSIAFKVKNFGLSPAFKTASEIEVRLGDNTLTLPQDQMKGACSLAVWNSQGEDTATFGDSVVFPTGETTASFENVTGQPIELSKIRRVWIAGCIAYQGAASAVIHHTKFWILSYMIPENSIPVVVEKNPIMTKFSLPINGWQLVKTEAD